MAKFLFLHPGEDMTLIEASNPDNAITQFNEQFMNREYITLYELVDMTPVEPTGDPSDAELHRRHTFSMSERQAERIHKLVSGHCSALKNWIASAIEAGDRWTASTPHEMVSELRAYEELFARFNMGAKRDWAKHFDERMQTNHFVADRRN